MWVEAQSAQEVGDESKLLSAYTKVIAAPNPIAALELITSYKPEIIIFDDGMQNPSFHKDLIILTVNASRGFGNRRIIPAGPLRQSLKTAIAAADISIFIGETIYLEEKELFDKKPFCAQIKPRNIKLDGEYLAFAGISNPEGFFALLRQYNVIVKLTKIFPDHYNYSEKDLHDLQQIAKQHNLELITTEKDYVKIGAKVKKLHYLLVDLELDPLEEQKLLEEIQCHLNKNITK